MGRVLVEKLLRTCNDVNRLYLVIRTRKGQEPAARIKEFTDDELFGLLLEKYPNAFDKVTIIPGDVSEIECGISKEDQQILRDNVSVVFHTAASVRFDDSVTKAVKLNTRGTHELLKMAENFKKLEVFEYVSTTYCNFNLYDTVGEKVYPSHLDWKTLVALVDKDGNTLNSLQHKLQGTQINTYVLTKSLAENIVEEYSNRVPVVIVRPSVVVPSLQEPFPGWINNLNGLMGVVAGNAKGVMRVFHCDPEARVGFVPVDVAINGLLVGAWSKRFLDDGVLQVFNEAYGDKICVTNRNIVDQGAVITAKYPMENYLWYPFCYLTKNRRLFHILFLLMQVIPALLVDLVLKICGKKPMLTRITRHIYVANLAISEFVTHENQFSNTKFRNIFTKLSPIDREQLVVSEEQAKDFDENTYMTNALLGLKKYFFHEKEEDLPRYRRNQQRLYYLHVTVKVLFWTYVLYKLALCASSLVT
ncbi:Male sterility protein [Nesidiocoris tenuis]|nr:Male sterility protein [Nesidiocoris tenuis]